MQSRKSKFITLLVFFVFIFFFSNDFGLINVEKTSIITAVAIDYENDEYVVTAQIAVPEATDTNTENQKAQLSGKGATVGEALKDLGDVSGWFPKLSFCNLIILGNSLTDDNVIKAVDYFTKTLRVQDSALIALSEKNAKDLLTLATPLDNISSFALQKIILKNTGFDKDVAQSDVKTFCSDYYSISESSYMPLIKVIPAGESQKSQSSGGGTQNSGGMNPGTSASDQKGDKDNLFDAKTTALFLKGKKVGELDNNLTLIFNMLTSPIKGTVLTVKDMPDKNGEKSNYLLMVMRSIRSVKVKADENDLKVKIKINLYCKITDHTSKNSDYSLSQNIPIPKIVLEKLEKDLTSNIEELIETSKQSGCDFLQLKQKLYRNNYKHYARYKDNYLSVIKPEIKVTVSGQT